MDYDGLWKLAKEKSEAKAAALYPPNLKESRAEAERMWAVKYYDEYTRPSIRLDR